MIKFFLKSIIKFFKNNRDRKKFNLVKKILGDKKIRLLDVGAAGGIEEFQDSWKPYIEKVDFILCEPHKESYTKIKSSENRIINKVLSNEKKLNNIFYETQKPECSSTKEFNLDYLKKFPKVERFEVVKKSNIESTTIDHEFNHANFPHFIKIDTEGSELDILKGGEKTLESTLGLVVETYFSEFHKNQVKFGEIKNFLKSKNFEFIDFIRLVKWERHNHRHHGQVQVADVLFLISPEEILSKYKAKKIDINILKIYTSILVIYNRSDYLFVILNNLEEKIQRELLLKESYNFSEKSVKRIHFIENIFKFVLKNFV